MSLQYPDVTVAYQHVDAATIHLVTDPSRYDVIVTDNLFGDILTDLAAAVTGGIGLAASGNLDASGTNPSMFEPVHGSAPDIAGKGVANPLATFLSVALMLRHGLARPGDASRLEGAVERALERGLRTPDLAWVESERPPMSDLPAEVEVGTREMTDAVIEELER